MDAKVSKVSDINLNGAKQIEKFENWTRLPSTQQSMFKKLKIASD